jgi:hypothetical protein
MQSVADHPPELGDRWRTQVVLKRDVFSTVERGIFASETGDVSAVLRRLDQVPFWSFIVARHLFRREQHCLARAGGLGIAPRLLFGGRRVLVRSFIDGTALHIARPKGDLAYFRSAKTALRRLHRAGITHNDLAKEQNWLRGSDGRAYLTDFQLAMHFKRRTRFFRLAAYEDMRHLLKHKRTYAPDALTPAEKRVLARKSWITRIWMATGKKVYRGITRGIFNFTDREGGGPRLVYEAPQIVDILRKHPGVRDVAVVAFADRRAGVGLYTFVEGDASLDETALRQALRDARLPALPEHIQIAQALPRGADGTIRSEILQLIATNQVDLIGGLIASEEERATVDMLLAQRRNLRDKFAY